MRRSLRRADGQPRSPGEIPDLAGQISVIGTLTGFGIDNAFLSLVKQILHARFAVMAQLMPFGEKLVALK